MAADPISDAFALADSTLHADTTFMGLVSSVNLVSAPPGTLPDYCLISAQSATDTNTATAVRVLTRLILNIQIVGPIQDFTNMRAAFARMEALLAPSGQPLRNQDSTLALYRQQALSYGEMVNGVLWLHHGGLYRVEV